MLAMMSSILMWHLLSARRPRQAVLYKESDQSYIFTESNHPASKQVAIVPKSKVLYINELSEDG